MTNTVVQGEAFEHRAQRILAYLKSNLRYDKEFLPRPYFIELTGSPSAGKTTTITELYKFLRRLGFRVLRPQEGAEVIQHIPRTTPVYNARTGMYALTILMDEAFKHTYDIVILDRGIFDTYAWMLYWLDKGKLTEADAQLIQQFFLSPLWVNLIDAAFFMVCQPEEAMRREQRIALSQRLGETTNPDSIAKLVDRYVKAYDILRPNHSQLTLLDTTPMGEQEMVDRIATLTLDALEKRAIVAATGA